MPDMKTLTIGNTTYLIVDKNAAQVVTPDNLYFDTDTSMLYLMSNGEIVGDGVRVAAGSGGGSGGGSTNNAVLTLKNTSGWTYKNVSQSSTCKIAFTWSSLEDGVSTGMGAVTVKVGGVLRYSTSIAQGDVELDVSSYLSNGSNTIRISVSDIYGNSRTIAFTINVISLTLTSSFDSSTAYTGAITFPYIPTGAVEKTVRFILDGVEIGHTTTSISGRQQSFSIPAQKHGSHTLFIYFEADIDGELVTSNGLYYDIICLESGNTTPIITSSFRDTEAEQYVTFAIPYTVYDPQSLTSTITLYANGTEVNTLTVDRTAQTWSYRPDDSGNLTLIIECTGASGKTTRKQFTINVAETQIGAEVTTEDLALYLSAYGRSNNEANPGVWSYNDIDVQFSNFNYKTDGWHTDSEGATVMRVTGDARLTIPYKMFANDSRSTGKTIEIEFATRDVLNYDAVLLSCMSGGRGLQVTTQKATLSSEQSSIGTQYKEEEHVRLSFVIEKKTNTKLLLCYINGILSGSIQYPDEDDFSQGTPVDISIGSNECTTDIYNIRVYDNDLTRHQILDNWIGDTQIGVQRKERYERNNVYDAYGTITPDTLKKDLPYLILVCPVLPTFKGDKKTCSGSYVDPVNPKNSFTFENAQIDVQGTSSQYYYVKNFKIKFKGGFILYDGNTVELYQMRDSAIPVSTFTFKADVASSEGANNVVLAQIYNDLCPVKTPPQEKDPKVRQTIDGHPIVIFWDNGTETKFIGKYNFNNDKGTEDVFGFTEGDESWEIRQNGTERTGFRSADFSGTDWQNDFEARYPEDNLDPTKLAELAEWLVSTNADAATNETLSTPVTYDSVEYTTDSPEYRLAKFKAELADHANVDAMVYYYVITELFLCIDQREKNAFPTIFKDDPYWMMFFYDADSSLGIDNKGNLAFDYYLEDIDYTEAGDPVFNGQASVLWVNLRKCFYDKILEEYKRLRTTARSDGSSEPLLSYNVVNSLFEAHQGKWSEAIYNEDGYRKSIEPYVLNGDTLYLPMLQGKKEQQRKWWLYNRFRYLDSKYNTGSSMENRITIRAHAQANIKLIAYVNMYGHVYYNSEMAEHRMYRGREYEFVWAATGAEDAVIGINDADMLTSLGDLSGLMVELIDISKATHLTALKVGDASEGYVNKNLNSITLGNNILLRTLDLRNCTNLTQSVDASGCTSIEEIYLDGTAVSSVSVPNGGGLKILHLPSTITNLTLRNQTALTDFTIPSYSNITTLRLENNSSAVDPLAILNAIPENSRVRVLGVKMEVDSANEIMTLFDRLDTMRGMDENGNNVDKAQMSGTITIDDITGSDLAKLQGRYTDITIKYNHLITKLTFCNYDGTVLKTIDVLDGGDGVYTGETPERAATESAIYTFVGWSKAQDNVLDETALKVVTTDRTVYAVYGVTPIYYVKYYTHDGSNLLFTDKLIGVGLDSSYEGVNPTRAETTTAKYTFAGWSKTANGSADADALENITANRNVYAAYTVTPIYYVKYYNHDGSKLLFTDKLVGSGLTSSYEGSTPTRAETSTAIYTFSGWSLTANGAANGNALKNVTADRNVYAAYTVTPIYYVHFYNYDGSSLLFTDKLVGSGLTAAYEGSIPTRESTAQYSYAFAGWSTSIDGSASSSALTNVTADRNVYLVYTATIRTYTVTWKNGSNTLEIDINVPYGTVPTYNSADPVYSGSNADDYEWIGWTPAVAAITGDTTYIAQFKCTVYYYSKIIDRRISGEYSNSLVTTTIGERAFHKCSNLTSVNFPVATSIGVSSFQYCTNLTSVNFPVATSIGVSSFRDCTNLTSVNFPVATSIDGSSFQYCTNLTTVILRTTEKVCSLLNDNVFRNTPIASGTGYIYVPRALVDSYKAATNWSTYANQIRAIEDYPDITGGETE